MDVDAIEWIKRAIWLLQASALSIMQKKTFIFGIKNYANITYGKQFVFIELKVGEMK